MDLGVATHFSQGWSTDIVQPADDMRITLFRDSIPRNDSKDHFDFSIKASPFVEDIKASGIGLMLVYAYPKSRLDGDQTPHSYAGRKEFAEHVAYTLKQYPFIKAIEIGNEFNSPNFVSGKVKQDPYKLRDDYYFELLKETYTRIKREFPDVTVIGGATHSIPVQYLQNMFDLGALDYMDAIAVHPYSSPPEQLAQHLTILKRAMGDNQKPIYITEFGLENASKEDSANYLQKMVAIMSSSGVDKAIWYALREQKWFKNMELLTIKGKMNPAGSAYTMAQNVLLFNGSAEDISPDPFTYLYRYGSNMLVGWGAPRDYTFTGDGEFFTASGVSVQGKTGQLNEDQPFILIAKEPIEIGGNFILDQQRILGDIYHQFNVTAKPEERAPWTWHAIRNDKDTHDKAIPLSLMAGGGIAGENWRPYLGDTWMRPLMVTERGLYPIIFNETKENETRLSIRERFTFEKSATVRVSGIWTVNDASIDGVRLKVSLNGTPLAEELFQKRYNLDLDTIEAEAGDQLDFVLDNNANASGDATRRRIKIIEINH